MPLTLIWIATLSLVAGQATASQAEPTAPRSTTERPNMSAPGLEQTLTGVLMDAACGAIADSRSDLTSTPRILPPRNSDVSGKRRTEHSATDRSGSMATTETDIPERYRGCKLKSSTTSFALYVNGRVYMLDRASNQMMQEHMLKNTAGTPQTNSSGWTTRTLVGTPTSDDVLTLRSIRVR